MKKSYFMILCTIFVCLGLIHYVQAISLTDMTDVPNEAGISQIKASINANYDNINANNELIEALDADDIQDADGVNVTKSFRGSYTFAGALVTNGSMGITLPDNFCITKCFYQLSKAALPTNATISLTSLTADDILGSTAVWTITTTGNQLNTTTVSNLSSYIVATNDSGTEVTLSAGTIAITNAPTLYIYGEGHVLYRGDNSTL